MPIPSPVASPANTAQMVPGPPPGAASAEELQELVSPIAIYPDLLIAQILVASTYPNQIVDSHAWLKQNSNLSGDQLADAVNAQPWDPSIKSLTQFPSVLQTMNDSLAWTSALGEAYYNQPDDVMAAIQTLRNRAVSAGTLKSTPEQKIEVQPASAPVAAQAEGQQTAPQQTIIIQPAEPNVVYVPQYNPSTVYGAPVQSPPGYTGTEMVATGLVSFGVGMALGALINEGNNDWECDWHGGHGGGNVHYNKNVYANRTNVMSGRSNYAGNYQGGNYTRQPGGYPRATPYRGAGARQNPAGPATRPYNRADARRYAANNPNVAKPNFPKPSTLPSNPSLGTRGKNPAENRPSRASSRAAEPPNRVATRAQQPATRPARAAEPPAPSRPRTANRGADQMRGFGGGGDTRGGRTGAFGGYQPGGAAQASGNRGRASFAGGGGGGGRGGGGRGGGGRGGGGRRR